MPRHRSAVHRRRGAGRRAGIDSDPCVADARACSDSDPPERAAIARTRDPASPVRRRVAGALLLSPLAACTTPAPPPTAPATAPFTANELLKSDIDAVADVHLRESMASAQLVMDKLYRRNPRELRKRGAVTVEAAVARAFDPRYHWRFAELSQQRGTAALLIAFRQDFAGDRVFAFAGLRRRPRVRVRCRAGQHDQPGLRRQARVLPHRHARRAAPLQRGPPLDAQRLYNAARNVEIAAWKLASARDPAGELLLLSNEASAPAPNLSIEREIGKLVAYQDTLALVMAQRNNRTIRRFSQGVATAVFLPL